MPPPPRSRARRSGSGSNTRRAFTDGQRVTADLVRQVVKHHGERLASQFPARELSLACRLYEEGMTNEEFPEFLTLRAYEMLE